MANIINERNHLEYEMLEKQHNFKEQLKKSMYLLATILTILCLINPYSFIILISMTVIFIIPFSIFIYSNNSRADVQLVSTLEGKQRTLGVLNLLGPEYMVISNVKVVVNEKITGQIDSIVIGPNGIFIIENKNTRGHIIGKETEKEIVVYEEDRKGKQCLFTSYNPCKQVNGQVYKLLKILRQEGINHWVQGIIFFSNIDTTIEFETTKVPVFCFSQQGAYLVRQYILNYNNGKRLSLQERKRIIDILSKYIIETPILERS